MKTYIITEKDIENLKYGSRHSIDDILDNLQEIPVNDLDKPFEVEMYPDTLEEKMKRFQIIELKSREKDEK